MRRTDGGRNSSSSQRNTALEQTVQKCRLWYAGLALRCCTSNFGSHWHILNSIHERKACLLTTGSSSYNAIRKKSRSKICRFKPLSLTWPVHPTSRFVFGLTTSQGFSIGCCCSSNARGLAAAGAAGRRLRRLFLRRFAGASSVGGSELITEGSPERKASHHSRAARFSPLVSAARRRYARASANSGLLTMTEGRRGGLLCSEGCMARMLRS